MTDVAETTITITPEVAGLLRDAVTTEGYESANDAIRDALLYRFAQRDDLFGLTDEDIDRLIDEADASGEPVEIDIEDIKREGFRRAGVPYPRGVKGRLVRTPRASRDLAEIIAYIAADNPLAADRVADQLEAKSRMLAESPGLGRPHYRPGTRVFSSGSYLILYRQTSDGIAVLRYYHGRRDPRRL